MICTCGHHANDHVVGLTDSDMSMGTFRPCFLCGCMELSAEAREAQATQNLNN